MEYVIAAVVGAVAWEAARRAVPALYAKWIERQAAKIAANKDKPAA